MADVEYEVEGGTAWIVLNRPEQLNTVTWTVIKELLAATRRAVQDDAVRVICYRGEGPSFSAGADLKELQQEFADIKAGTLDRAEVRQVQLELQEVTRILRHTEKLSIAAVQGWVVGAGLEVCVACDFVIADETARFYFAEARAGLTITGGASYLLPRIVGLANARRLVHLAQPIDASEAARLGLVSEVVPRGRHDAKAREYAESITGTSPLAVAAHKMMLERGADIDLETALELEAATVLALIDLPEVHEGIAAFIEKRPPNF